ncbi:hypothetical protein KC356_g319 [Hortaea werneckii]|nr:hypothetical protein KC356_g319 [Hortaea werneckii]
MRVIECKLAFLDTSTFCSIISLGHAEGVTSDASRYSPPQLLLSHFSHPRRLSQQLWRSPSVPQHGCSLHFAWQAFVARGQRCDLWLRKPRPSKQLQLPWPLQP